MKPWLMTGACALATAAPGPAFAFQERPADTGLEEIIVTAQRRDENLQKVPIAVTAISAARLETSGVNSSLDLQTVTSGLQIRMTQGAALPTIRGIGSASVGPGIEYPVAFYVDGVYQASSAGNLLSLNNIERIEVLKGPQGTLFGRNATAGLVQIITSTPSHDLSGKADISYGRYQTGGVDLYVTGGLTDTLAADLAVHYTAQGEGYGRNLANGKSVYRDDHDLALRSKILWEPDDRTTLTIAGDYAHKRSSTLFTINITPGQIGLFNSLNAAVYKDPIVDYGGFYNINQDTQPLGVIKSWGLSLQAQHDLGTMQLKNIVAVRQTRLKEVIDLDFTPYDYVASAASGPRWQQFTEELQLSSNGTSRFKWTTGLYYFHAHDSWDPLNTYFGARGAATLFQIPAPSIEINTFATQRTDSVAAYGQGSYELLDTTRLTVGGRYTRERRGISGNSIFSVVGLGFPPVVSPVPAPTSGIPRKISADNFSYRIALDHNFSPGILGYLSYNTAFKGGGYNILSAAINPPFLPERVKTAEAGLKLETSGKRLRINTSVFYTDYKNIQVTSYTGTSLIISNGAGAEIYGADMDIEARVMNELTLFSGLSLIHDRFTSFADADFSYLVPGCNFANPGASRICQASAKGNKLQNAPTFSGNVGFDWHHGLEQGFIDLSSNLSYNSGWYGTADNNPVNRQRRYALLSAALSWQPGRRPLKLTLWGKNLTGQRYSLARYTGGNNDFLQSAAAPRTYGAKLGVEF